MGVKGVGGRAEGGVAVPSSFLLFLLTFMLIVATLEAKCETDAVLFNFGDSNSDTGGIAAGLGYDLPLPEGRVFFHRSTGRVCDGRLIIDYLCESLNTTFLSPYLESLGSNFKNGANFAIAGSATQPRNQPFSLHIQVQQFLHFRSRSLELIAQGSKDLINEEGFQKALYMFDIGQNDLSGAFGLDFSYERAMERIPLILSETKDAIKTIYDHGGRNFWVHNTGPLGCLPEKLSQPRKNDSDLDAYGCLKTVNNGAKEFNTRLNTLCEELNSELKNSTIVYTDIYSLKYDLIANYTEYGFVSPVMACCGYGGPPYNFNINVTCLSPGFQVCEAGTRYVSWDGVHYTEVANALVASKILTTDYSKPPVKFDFFCSA